MVTYAVEQLDTVAISANSVIDDMDLMSPFVWKVGDLYRIMVRGVPHPLGPHDPTGIIARGESRDGLSFTMDPGLAITPGPGAEDMGGCEDPTVLTTPDHEYLINYTGVDADRSQGCMILAAGRDLTALVKEDLVLKAPPGGATSRKPRWCRRVLATGGCSTNTPRMARRGSAWRVGPLQRDRGPCCPIHSGYARTVGTIGICRPGRSGRRRVPTR